MPLTKGIYFFYILQAFKVKEVGNDRSFAAGLGQRLFSNITFVLLTLMKDR